MKRKFYNIKGIEEGCSIRIMFNVLPKELTDIREYDILDLKQHVLKHGWKACGHTTVTDGVWG